LEQLNNGGTDVSGTQNETNKTHKKGEVFVSQFSKTTNKVIIVI